MRRGVEVRVGAGGDDEDDGGEESRRMSRKCRPQFLQPFPQV